LIAYSITSSSGALDSLAWTSIADHYDASGDGSVDANEEWVEFTAPGSTFDLSEGVFYGAGGSIAPGQIVSMGFVWDTSAVADLKVIVLAPDSGQAIINLEYSMVDADYDNNGVVDQRDFTVWRDTLDSTTNLQADGNGNGIIDLGDYNVWKSQFHEHASTAAHGQASVNSLAASVPEPGTLTMALGILIWSGVRMPTDRVRSVGYAVFRPNHQPRRRPGVQVRST
jgi:hypothetical protein